MAAEQIPGRLCACGCQRSLDGMQRATKKHPDCTRRLELERKRAWGRAHPERHRDATWKGTEREQRKSLGPRRIVTRNADGDSGQNVRQKPCQVCCGMPWARLPTRYLDHIGGEAVAGDSMLCSGCGEGYAPEPPPERVSVLCSSAGTAARAGAMYGFGAKETVSVRTSRAKPKP